MSEQRSVEIAKFDDLDDTWVQTGGFWTRCVFMGPKNSPDGPVGIAIKAGRDVGDRIAGKRSFPVATALSVLRGNVMHDGKWMSQGDLYVSPPNEMNGDLLFGPEGAVIFILFNKRSGIIPTFQNSKDQENFDRLLRKDVEEVASGECEKSVAILPQRSEYSPGRAIVFKTVEEVNKYREGSGLDW